MTKKILIVGVLVIANLLGAQSNEVKASDGTSEIKVKQIPWQMISSADESFAISKPYVRISDTNSNSEEVSTTSKILQPKLPAKQVKTKVSAKPKPKSKQKRKIYFAPPPVLRDMPDDDTINSNSLTPIPDKKTLMGEHMNAVYDDGSFQPEGPGGDDPYIKSHEVEPIANPDVKASFPGGEVKFYEYLRNYLQFPARCMEEGISGSVKLRFVVNIQGNISQIKILEETKSCPEFTQEAIRVIKNSPKWIPAQINGRFVNSYMIIPVKFALQ